MNIQAASQELYLKLRLFNEVVGIDVRDVNGVNYIVVYLATVSGSVKEKIPKKYKGNLVKTELLGRIATQ